MISEFVSQFSSFKARRVVALAYVFLLGFVVVTVLLAFNPSHNSTSPWLNNVFVRRINSISQSDAYRSHISSVVSFFFPEILTSQRVHKTNSLHIPSNDNRSNDTTAPAHLMNKQEFHEEKHSKSPKTKVTDDPKTKKHLGKDRSQIVGNSNEAKGAPLVVVNQSAMFAGASGKKKKGKGKGKKRGAGKGAMLDSSLHPENEDVLESLMNCNLYDGEWVKDDPYPLYQQGSCPLIDEQFDCFLNGRPDKAFQNLRWKPKGCNLPRLNASHMLDLLRGKRLVFVGDSLNRNMWVSLVCILRNSVKDQSKVYEVHGRHHFRGDTWYSFILEDYNCSVEFFVSPFLVQEWEMPDKKGSKKETLRLDLIERSCDQYKGADFIIFNTGHWWTHEKTSQGKDYYQEGSHVYGELHVLEAFRRALTTWSRWVYANVNNTKSLVFFRGYSASHFSGGEWNSGGACNSREPFKNETHTSLSEYLPMMTVLDSVLEATKARITYLNITQLTNFRKDAHPSIYWKQNMSEAERRSPTIYQDCSHWCLPGVPDAWNELLYAEILIRMHHKQQHH